MAPAELTEPSYAEVCKIRTELGIVGEMLSALMVADAEYIRSFGYDESTKLQIGILSTNAQIKPGPFVSKLMSLPLEQRKLIDVALRGAAVIPGGTAMQVVQALESKFFARGRKLLVAWRDEYETQNGEGTWPGPDPSQLGTHQLGADCLLLTDTCTPARCSRRLLIEAVRAAVEAKAGAQAWAAMSEAERDAKARAREGDCMQHMRNIFLSAMAEAASKHLAERLEESLANFSSFERMSTDAMQLIRAVFKEMHPEGDYAKGKGREFWDWLEKNCPSDLFIRLERAGGGRQDLAFDGMLPIFVDRPILAKFLREHVFVPGHSNVLESFLWAVLSSQEAVALIRALTLVDLLISRPMRWLSGKSSQLKDWSIYKMGEVMDMVEQVLVRAAADGKTLLDPSLDIFASVAREQQLFADWRAEIDKATIKSHDGTLHHYMAAALKEAREPTLQVHTAPPTCLPRRLCIPCC